MKQKPETLQTQTEREAQNIKTPTYKELLEENKKLKTLKNAWRKF